MLKNGVMLCFIYSGCTNTRCSAEVLHDLCDSRLQQECSNGGN